jgi:threonylcarbamoyladenosine tRNA methylthiotransferase MtaB
MNVAFHTLGCKLNYAETSHLQHLFEQAGHTVVPFAVGDGIDEHAENRSEDRSATGLLRNVPFDAVIINTCTVTENADRECRQIVRRALRYSPAAFVGVTGCYAQLQPEQIASIEGVDAVFGAKEKFRIPELVRDFRKSDTPHCFVSDLDTGGDLEFVEAQSAETDSRTRAFLKLQDGCNYKCSFCTIPLARGASRSMEFGAVPEKLRSLRAAGYHEVVLSGINLGDYKAPTGERFADVVRLADDVLTSDGQMISGLKDAPALRLRISSIEPNLLTQEIIDVVRDSQVFCPSFHIPLQSGSPEILRQMRRRYKVEHYRDLVARILVAMPDAAIGVDVIVGFPGESDAHFEETFTLLQELPVAYFHVFSYSERANTPAAELSAQGAKVPAPVRAERSKRLRTLSAKKKFAFYSSQLGSIRTTIPEQKNPASGLWRGWTENYVRVEFQAPAAMLQKPVAVRLLTTDGEVVQAEIVQTEIVQDDIVQAEIIPTETSPADAAELSAIDSTRRWAAATQAAHPTYIPIML